MRYFIGILFLAVSFCSAVPANAGTHYPFGNNSGIAVRRAVNLSFQEMSALAVDLSKHHQTASYRLTNDTEKATWNAKSSFSGAYSDLTGKPILANLTSDSTHRTVTDLEKATWNAAAGGTGTVSSVSVVSANGFAGSVATSTTTPEITLTTSVTGILKGNGTAISAASAGTDYLTPSGSGASLTGITATQVGLGSVTNNAQVKKAASSTNGAIPTWSGTSGDALNTGGITAPSGAIVGTTDTQTLTNKRVTQRVGTTASSATPAINTDTTDLFTITALAADITSMTSGMSGTPTTGQALVIRIKDNGTGRAITWGTAFASRGATLPTTTVASKYLYVAFIWNEVTSTWDCIGSRQEA